MSPAITAFAVPAMCPDRARNADTRTIVTERTKCAALLYDIWRNVPYLRHLSTSVAFKGLMFQFT
jgi:hypothetical protein